MLRFHITPTNLNENQYFHIDHYSTQYYNQYIYVICSHYRLRNAFINEIKSNYVIDYIQGLKYASFQVINYC